MQSSKITRSGNLFQLDTGDKVTEFPFSGEEFDALLDDYCQRTMTYNPFDALFNKEWQMECEAFVALIKDQLPESPWGVGDAEDFLCTLRENLERGQVGDLYIMSGCLQKDGTRMLKIFVEPEFKKKVLSLEPAIDELDTVEDRFSRLLTNALNELIKKSAVDEQQQSFKG